MSTSELAAAPTALEAIRTRQPRAFYMLFFVELWERFGYYGMAALLVLYMSKALHFTDDTAYDTFGALVAMVYVTPILGGYLGDKLLGYKRSLLIGSVLLAIGYAMLAIPNVKYLYTALAFIIIGCGYFKTMPSVLLGKLYSQDDPRVDGAYTVFYMSINIGSLLSIGLSGPIAQYFGWHTGFGICSIGLVVGIINYWYFRDLLANVGSEADFKPISFSTWLILAIGTVILISLATFLLRHIHIAHGILLITGISVLLILAKLIISNPPQIRNKLTACLIFTFFAITFFVLYFQAPMALSLFIDRNVDHHILGIFVPTSSYWALNGFWIVVLAPFLAVLYNHFGLKQLDLSIAMKFALGIIIMGFGFLVLTWCQAFASATSQVSSWWIVLSYFLQSLAELLVSAIGVSMIIRLAPTHLFGLMMGTWFLGTAAAGMISGQVAKLASVPQGKLDPAVSLHIYGHAFFQYGVASIIVGIIALLLVPTLNKLTGEKRVTVR